MSASRLSRRSCLFLHFRRGNNEHVNFSSLSGCPPSRATPPRLQPVASLFLCTVALFSASLLSLVIGRLLMARDCLSNPVHESSPTALPPPAAAANAATSFSRIDRETKGSSTEKFQSRKPLARPRSFNSREAEF